MSVLGDSWFEGSCETSLVFIYEYGGVLSGIEGTAMSGHKPRVLPAPESLHPIDG